MSADATTAQPTAPAEAAPQDNSPASNEAGNPPDAAADAAQQAADTAQQKRGESDAEFEVRLSKLTREARMARADAERFKGVATKASDEAKALKAELEKARSKKGISRQQYVQLTNAINAAADDPSKLAQLFDEDEAQIPAALKEKLEALERETQERRAREAQANYSNNRRKEEAFIGNVMKEMTESGDCPLFDAFPGYAGHILDLWYQEWKANGQTESAKPDPYEIASKVHKEIAGDLLTALQSEKARSFLLKAKPELKALLQGQEVRPSSPTSEKQGAGRGNGSPAKPALPTVSRTTSEPKSKLDRYSAEEQRVQQSLDAYREYQMRVKSGKA